MCSESSIVKVDGDENWMKFFELSLETVRVGDGGNSMRSSESPVTVVVVVETWLALLV